MSDFIGTKLTMNLGERSYDIILKNGALENLYQFARLDRKVAVVTDSGVPAEYAQRVADQCRESTIITVPQGEASKSFKILETVLRQMLEFNMGRGDLVVAVGGGVVGDLAGFAAAIYMRGIDFINCPTTTLSMIDSSIGGKTAVDLGRYQKHRGRVLAAQAGHRGPGHPFHPAPPPLLSTVWRRRSRRVCWRTPSCSPSLKREISIPRSARSSTAACGSRRTS